MTAKEKQLKMLEALDLRVGDVVEVKFSRDKKLICKIFEGGDSLGLAPVSHGFTRIYEFSCLLDYDFEVIEYHQKTWGEYKCGALRCADCPLIFLACVGSTDDTLSDRLDKIAYKFPNTEKGKKIYEACKEMLNEVRDDTPRT